MNIATQVFIWAFIMFFMIIIREMLLARKQISILKKLTAEKDLDNFESIWPDIRNDLVELSVKFSIQAISNLRKSCLEIIDQGDKLASLCRGNRIAQNELSELEAKISGVSDGE